MYAEVWPLPVENVHTVTTSVTTTSHGGVNTKPAHRSTHLTEFILSLIIDYTAIVTQNTTNNEISLINIEICTTATIRILYSILYHTSCDLMMAQKSGRNM